MTAVDVDLDTREADVKDLNHTVCCRQRTTPAFTLCGQVGEGPLVKFHEYAAGDCMACELIHQTDPFFCPVRGRCINER